jgi:hypothetical protein
MGWVVCKRHWLSQEGFVQYKLESSFVVKYFRLAQRVLNGKQICLAIIAFTASPFCFSATPVYFAGFALSGNAVEAEVAFPITSKILQETNDSGGYLLEQALWASVQAATHPELDIKRELGSGDDASDLVAMAFVLDWENVSSEQVAGSTKLVVDLHGQALIFDFDSKKVIGSYPIAVQLLHSVDGPTTPELAASLVRRLYLGTEGESIFRRFAERLSTVSVRPSRGNYIRVVSVDLEDNARQALADFAQDEAVVVSRVADSFGKRLAEHHKVSFVPYAKGSAIGSKMAARFANGDIYQLELPEPDYRVHLRLRGFKKVLLDSNSVESAWAYGTFMNVAVKDFDDQKVYLDAPFKFGAVKKVVAGSANIDDWTAFQESMFSLIDQIAVQSANPDKDWVAQRSGGGLVMDQLQELKRVIERTR